MPFREVDLIPALVNPLRSVFDTTNRRGRVPPGPPGPLDRIIDTNPNGYSTSYTNVHPNVHFRLAFLNGAASIPTISVTVDGTPATLVVQDAANSVGTTGVAAFYVTGLAAGNHTIAINVSAGTLTKAALRVGELVTQTGIGVNGASVQGGASNYYIEIDNMNPLGAPGTSQMGTIYATTSQDVYANYPDTEQWKGSMPGLTFRFGTGASPSGEGGGLFVAYVYNYGFNSGLVYEIRGATLP